MICVNCMTEFSIGKAAIGQRVVCPNPSCKTGITVTPELAGADTRRSGWRNGSRLWLLIGIVFGVATLGGVAYFTYPRAQPPEDPPASSDTVFVGEGAQLKWKDGKWEHDPTSALTLLLSDSSNWGHIDGIKNPSLTLLMVYVRDGVRGEVAESLRSKNLQGFYGGEVREHQTRPGVPADSGRFCFFRDVYHTSGRKELLEGVSIAFHLSDLDRTTLKSEKRVFLNLADSAFPSGSRSKSIPKLNGRGRAAFTLILTDLDAEKGLTVREQKRVAEQTITPICSIIEMPVVFAAKSPAAGNPGGN